MTKKLLWSISVLCLSLTAYADADHDPNLDAPVELYIDKSVTTNIQVDLSNAQPAYVPNHIHSGSYNNVNYYYDNRAPLPMYGSLVPVVINVNQRISSRGLSPITDLMQFVQYELNKQGYNTNLGFYGVQSVRLGVAAMVQGSQVALANQHSLIASTQVPHYMNNVILYNAIGNMSLLNWPLSILFQGQIDLQNITVFLAPLVNTNPTPPWGGGGGYYPPPHYPQNYIQLGNTKIFDKRPISGRSQTVIFRNLDAGRSIMAYPGYRQIVIDVTGNTFVATKVKVEYVDRYGYIDSIVLTSRKTSVRDGNYLNFEIPHGVSVRSVTVDGYSPNIKGSRARVAVGLR